MSRADPPSMSIADRPVLPWRIVAGAFLHLALPAYLIVGLACAVAGLLVGLTPVQLAARALPYSVRFGVGYLLAAGTVTLAAALLDPSLRRRRQRRALRDPDTAERQSRRNLTIALAEGRSLLDSTAVSVLDTIAAIAWHHEEPAVQSVSADLAQVVRTSLAALASAKPQRRQELIAVTTATLTRIAGRLHDLQQEHDRLNEGDLRTVARYIDSRYPAPDCAGDSVR